MSALLEVKGLKSGYGRIPILFGVDLTVADGEYLGILGHNGMGKTTALRTLMGHLPTTDGSVVFAGKTITHLKPHERSRLGIGLVPQGREIFPDLSVMENLRMGLAAAPKEDRSVIDTVLQDFPRLVRLLDRRGGALSGGEQQLLALARCLCKADPAGRAHRGHPALHHRGDHRDASGAEDALEAVFDRRRAEPGIHHVVIGPHPAHPEGTHHRGTRS